MARTVAELSAFCDAVNDKLEVARQELLERVHAAQLETARSREEAAHTRRDLDRETAKIESLQVELATARQESALLRQRLDDHLKRVETWSGRLWALIVVLVGAVMSLTSGLVLTLNKK